MNRWTSLLVCAAAISQTTCFHRSDIVVGSKDFTEQILLGEIAAQMIERVPGITVERRLDLGGTMLTHLALTNGQIDLYPEYTGTAASSVLKQPLDTNPRRVFQTVSELYQKRYHLRWLPPLGFEDSFAMAVRSADARKLQSATLSAAAARQWKLGIGYEFLTRPDGLTRLDSVYPLKWEGLPSTMNLGLLYRALEEQQIDMAAANTTDGPLNSNAFTVLADDRHAFPPYQACFVIRDDVLKRYPAVERTLNRLSGKITADLMRSMNRRVDIDHVPVVKVAANFIQSLSPTVTETAQLHRYNRSGDRDPDSAPSAANAF